MFITSPNKMFGLFYPIKLIMKQRIALQLQYLGHHFHGWQKQPGALPTIQAHLDQAIAQIAGHSVETVAAGRTDRGVHALKQVVHFDSEVQRTIHTWIHGINHFLPIEIAVTNAAEVDMHFHARFSAHRRSYRYVLYNHSVRPVLLHGQVGWYFLPLDVNAMQEAACKLLGKHDFSVFRAAECQAKSPIKEIFHTDVYRQDEVICFDFTAGGFLHHMIRNIVGALIYVGSGKYTQQQFNNLLKERDRRLAPPTFMPNGLYLTNIAYPDKDPFQAALPTWFWGKNEPYSH